MNRCTLSSHIVPYINMVVLLMIISILIVLSQFEDTYGQITFSPQATINDPDLIVEQVASGLEMPTSMAFVGQDDILVLEKDSGKVKRILNGTVLPEPLLDVHVSTKGERGMLGIAVSSMSKSGSQNPITHIFLYFTESHTRDAEDRDETGEAVEPLGNRLYRYDLVNNGSKLVNPKLLLDLPASPGPLHNGGVIKIGKDGDIYLVIGDVRTPGNIQKVVANKTISGILRVSPDGEAINPSIFREMESLIKYYAYGIRNSFGMDFDPVTGKLWNTENGQGYGDEINLVEPGFNSGWRKVQGVWKSDGKIAGDKDLDRMLEDFEGDGKYSTPKLTWNSSVGLTALTFLPSDQYGEEYTNDMFVAAFHEGIIYRFNLTEDRTELFLADKVDKRIVYNEMEIRNHIFGEGFNGITDMKINQFDGYLYVLSFDLGTIYRIVPKYS